MELVWVSEREEIEVTRNWSDIKQLDLPMLTNYYKQVHPYYFFWITVGSTVSVSNSLFPFLSLAFVPRYSSSSSESGLIRHDCGERLLPGKREKAAG